MKRINNNKIEIELYSISELKKLFEKRIFAIPKLQREFVWNSNKAAQLLDSIYKSYPIGTILIWKAKKNKQFELNHHPSALPQYRAKSNDFIYFIIDGQQRLSVINKIMVGDLIKNYRNEEINFSNLFFLLDDETKQFKYLKTEREDTISVTQILSDRWKYKFPGTPKYKLDKIENCRERILKYKVPIIIVSGFDLDEIKQTFIRINSLGTPISSADQAFTLASNFNLKDRVKAVYQDFNQGYQNLPKEIILRTVALVWGIEEKGKRNQGEGLQFGNEEISNLSLKLDKNNEAQKRFNKIWKKLQYSFALAIDFISREFNVKDFTDLSSENMVMMLATFYYYHNNSQPKLFETKQIRKWFWYTGVGSRYSGRGYAKNIINDFVYFRKLGRGRNINFIIDEKVSKNEIINSDYRTSASLNKAFYTMLGLFEPKYFKGGGKILLYDYVSHKNKPNKHHIFPKDFLKNKVSSKKINSLANICLIVFVDNQEAKNKPPVVYLDRYRKGRNYKSFLRSHLIPAETSNGLYGRTKNDYLKFIEARAKIISNHFEKLAGTTLFEKK